MEYYVSDRICTRIWEAKKNMLQTNTILLMVLNYVHKFIMFLIITLATMLQKTLLLDMFIAVRIKGDGF